MSNEKMREEFERDWGLTNEEQGIYFIPELNMYGSEVVNRAAELKSSAWVYFQKGWKMSMSRLEVKLPVIKNSDWACSSDECEYIRQGITMSKHAINAAGIKVRP